MGHRELQRVIVRLHLDPLFAARFFAGLTSAGLAARDVELMLRVDPRAFRCDALRTQRLVHALLAELPLTGAIHGVPAIFSCLASDAFFAELDVCGSATLACARVLTADTHGVCALEFALARARRRNATTPAPTQVGCAPGVVCVALAAGTVQHHAQLLRPTSATIDRGDDVLARVLAGERATDISCATRQWVLLSPQADGWDIATVSDAMGQLLEHAMQPLALPQLVAFARTLGADDDDDARGIINDAIADGLLRASL